MEDSPHNDRYFTTTGKARTTGAAPTSSRRSRVRRRANELKTGPMGFNSSTNPMIHGAARERCPVERRMRPPPLGRHGHWTHDFESKDRASPIVQREKYSL